jgi:hypothetical protein
VPAFLVLVAGFAAAGAPGAATSAAVAVLLVSVFVMWFLFLRVGAPT